MLLSNAYLTLMIGPAVPLPAPLPVMEALKSIRVTSSRDRSGFQLSFSLGKRSPLQLAMLPMGYFEPLVTRVIITVILNGIPNVIMDGFITQHELQPGNEAGQSTLTVTGDDLTLAMDRIEIILPVPSMPDAAQVSMILAKYAFLGIVPVVMPTFLDNISLPTEQYETQNGTDLAHIQELASRNGFVFYINPGPVPGQSIAYFGPDINNLAPQSALNINMDAHTNLESLSFSLDGLKKRLDIINILDPVTGRIPIPVPMPDINIFKPPLGLRPLPPAKIKFDRNSAGLGITEALRNAIGRGLESSAPITGNGSLDVSRYGHILQSRRIVGVRGAGVSYDGLYYVDSVTHNIKPGEYKQSFSLSRDGFISNTPVVMP